MGLGTFLFAVGFGALFVFFFGGTAYEDGSFIADNPEINQTILSSLDNNSGYINSSATFWYNQADDNTTYFTLWIDRYTNVMTHVTFHGTLIRINGSWQVSKLEVTDAVTETEPRFF